MSIRTTAVALASGAALAAAAGLGATPAGAVESVTSVTSVAGPTVEPFEDSASGEVARSVTSARLLDHVRALTAAARANGGTRAAGTAGQVAAAELVERELAAAGFETSRVRSPVRVEEVTSTRLAIDERRPKAIDHSPMVGSPATPQDGVTGPLVSPSTPLGCTAESYRGVDAVGAVALVVRGGCTFAAKAAVAAQAGALGLVVANDAPGPLNGALGGSSAGSGTPSDRALVPTVAITAQDARTLQQRLRRGQETPITLIVQTRTVDGVAVSVIADRPGQLDAPGVVVLGARLDSAGDTLGATGYAASASALLETALALGPNGDEGADLRFAFWGGPGSAAAYLESLPADERARIRGHVNLDLASSPNHVLGVQPAAATGSATARAATRLNAAVDGAFARLDRRQAHRPVRSEVAAAFARSAIPTVTLSTGGTDVKSVDEARIYGGRAGVAYNQNVGTPLDDLSNIDTATLTTMGRLLALSAYAIAHDGALAAVPGSGGAAPGSGGAVPGSGGAR